MVKDILSQPTSIRGLNSSFTVNIFQIASIFLFLFCVPKLAWDFPRLRGIVTLSKFLSIYLSIAFHFLEGGRFIGRRLYAFTQGLHM